MTEEKKAIEYLENSFKNTITHKEQLNIIKNLMQRKQNEIEKLSKQSRRYDKQAQQYFERGLEISLELTKKDKIIDEMARFIEERLNECPYDFWIETEKELNCENCEEDYAKCWKQYFEKRVDKTNMNDISKNTKKLVKKAKAKAKNLLKSYTVAFKDFPVEEGYRENKKYHLKPLKNRR